MSGPRRRTGRPRTRRGGPRHGAAGWPASGVYLLALWLLRPRRIRVGGLGRGWFPRGLYLYAGSGRARLRARLGRHWRREKAPRWHIDHLRRHALVLGAAVAPWVPGRECAVARAALGFSGAGEVLRGFGSSDCRCRTHLARLRSGPAARHDERGGHTMKGGARKTGRKQDLLTLAAVARELGASSAGLRKAVQAAGIQPDAVRCGCAYYGPKARAAMRKLAKA